RITNSARDRGHRLPTGVIRSPSGRTRRRFLLFSNHAREFGQHTVRADPSPVAWPTQVSHQMALHDGFATPGPTSRTSGPLEILTPRSARSQGLSPGHDLQGLDETGPRTVALDPPEPALGAKEARHAPSPPHFPVTPAGYPPGHPARHRGGRLDRMGRRQR